MKNSKINTKPYIALCVLLVAVLFFSSCHHNSELKHEKGVVVEKQFSPEFNGSGSGVGISTGGNVVVTSNNIHKREQFMIVFKCQHNILFTIDRKDLYMNLDKGDTVDIKYYEILNRKNEVKDFDFVTATKK